MAAWQELRVGDRLRPVAAPPEWQQPGYLLPAETAELWRVLVARRRPLRVYEVDACGAPRVKCRIRTDTGGWEYHFLAITHGGWVRVADDRPRGDASPGGVPSIFDHEGVSRIVGDLAEQPNSDA